MKKLFLTVVAVGILTSVACGENDYNSTENTKKRWSLFLPKGAEIISIDKKATNHQYHSTWVTFKYEGKIILFHAFSGHKAAGESMTVIKEDKK